MAFTGSRTGNEASCLLKMTPSEMEMITTRWPKTNAGLAGKMFQWSTGCQWVPLETLLWGLIFQSLLRSLAPSRSSIARSFRFQSEIPKDWLTLEGDFFRCRPHDPIDVII